MQHGARLDGALVTPQRLTRPPIGLDSYPKSTGGLKRKDYEDSGRQWEPAGPLLKVPSVGSGVSAPSLASSGSDDTSAPVKVFGLPFATPSVQPAQSSGSGSSSVPSVVAAARIAAEKTHPFVPPEETVRGGDSLPCLKIGQALVPLRDDSDRRVGDLKFNPRVVALSEAVLKVPLAA